MKKIVKNNCYGGFGLSVKAKLEYAKRKGFDIYFYDQTNYGVEGGQDEFTKITPEQAKEKPLTYDLKEDLGDIVSGEEINEADWFHERHVDRDDPDLVEVVEELGDEANGEFAQLKVVEIPDGVDWEIQEYDGSEWVAEKHREWH